MRFQSSPVCVHSEACLESTEIDFKLDVSSGFYDVSYGKLYIRFTKFIAHSINL